MFGTVRCEDQVFSNHILLVTKQYLYLLRTQTGLPLIIKFFDYSLTSKHFSLALHSINNKKEHIQSSICFSLFCKPSILILHFIFNLLSPFARFRAQGTLLHYQIHSVFASAAVESVSASLVSSLTIVPSLSCFLLDK